jgi:hypothetical protein
VVFFSKALVSVFDCQSKLQPSPLHKLDSFEVEILSVEYWAEKIDRSALIERLIWSEAAG